MLDKTHIKNSSRTSVEGRESRGECFLVGRSWLVELFAGCGQLEKIMKMLLPGERACLRKGRQETLREDILDVLEARFERVPYAVREKIQEIQTEPRLKELHHQAVLVKNLDAFAKDL